MLNLNVFFQILEWKIPNQTDWQDWVALFSIKCDRLYTRIIEEFGPNGILVVSLFAFFLGIIVIIYIKSVIDTFRSASDVEENCLSTDDISKISEETVAQMEKDCLPTDDISEMSEETVAQLEAEKELSLHLVAASENSDDFLGISQDYERLKNTMQKYTQTQQEEFKTWQNSAKTEVLSATRLHIREMVSIIVKMLARQVSEPKIAQVLMQRSISIEVENVLQTIRSVRDFIGLANAQMFAELPEAKNLPKATEALRVLCEKGDNTLCLELLQKLTSQYVDDAMPENGVTRQMLLAQAANYACLTGNFAALDDMNLALTSYNFATEVSPESVNAWSRLGDAYMATGNEMKAMFAYQSVLELADPYMYKEQIANAKNHLAPYYERQELEYKALAFKQEATRYYEDYGLYAELTILEEAAADHIISRQDIDESLTILLPNIS